MRAASRRRNAWLETPAANPGPETHSKTPKNNISVRSNCPTSDGACETTKGCVNDGGTAEDTSLDERDARVAPSRTSSAHLMRSRRSLGAGCVFRGGGGGEQNWVVRPDSSLAPPLAVAMSSQHPYLYSSLNNKEISAASISSAARSLARSPALVICSQPSQCVYMCSLRV